MPQIEYTKSNIDGIQNRLTSMPSKVKDIWAEINMSEEEAEKQNIATEKEDLQKPVLYIVWQVVTNALFQISVGLKWLHWC